MDASQVDPKVYPLWNGTIQGRPGQVGMKTPDPIDIGGLIVALSPLAWALIYLYSKL